MTIYMKRSETMMITIAMNFDFWAWPGIFLRVRRYMGKYYMRRLPIMPVIHLCQINIKNDMIIIKEIATMARLKYQAR